MENFAMCRICLVTDVSMYYLDNTQLQLIYERLTVAPFQTNDRPLRVCYICYAKLQKCYQFQFLCIKSEELFSQLLQNSELKPQIKQRNQLRIDHVMNINIDPEGPVGPPDNLAMGDGNISLKAISASYIDIQVKRECTEEDDASYEDENPPNVLKSKDERKGGRVPKKRKIALQKKTLQNATSDLETEDRIEENEYPLSRITNKDENTKKIVRKPYKCDICDKGFTRKNDVKRHLLTHSDVKPYKCDSCEKSFYLKTQLRRHLRVHSDLKPYKCNICGHCFRFKDNLMKHIPKHTGVKPYKCGVCEKYFSRKNNLITHNRVHTGEKPYKCNVCEKRFSQKINLYTHIRLHTSENLSKSGISDNCLYEKPLLNNKILRKRNARKSFKCEICEKIFTRKGDFMRHVRTHTGEKPFKCNMCDKLFSLKENLRKHVRVHTGDKPYKCDICSKCFSQNGSLLRHSYTHR